MREIYNAEDIDKAQVAVKAFELDYGAKYPKAVAKIIDDLDVLLEFYKYPAEHWVHLRTTNPIVILSPAAKSNGEVRVYLLDSVINELCGRSRVPLGRVRLL